MKKLNYQTLADSGSKAFLLKNAPEKVLQFGEGNFLRGFVDYFIDVLNEKTNFNGKVVVSQPIAAGMAPVVNEQEGLYNLYMRGYENNEKVDRRRLISCISRAINPYENFQDLLDTAHNSDIRIIVSNTTEAGIVYDPNNQLNDAPPASFPAKLTRLLYERYKAFQDADGYIILSCELIDNNGEELRKIVEKHAADWSLESDFVQWLKKKNIFCSTLVDRIVTGYPKVEAEKLNKENGYEDQLIVTSEAFGLWVIEGPDSIKDLLPFEEAGLPIIVTADHSPYKKRKVRILNGAHTSMVLAAYLAGKDIVRDCMYDEDLSEYMRQTVFDEIIPTIDLPVGELTSFANSVIERFKNPFIDHSLLAISLNSVSKWRARVLPSMMDYFAINQKLPRNIVFSFAALIAFYSGSRTEGGKLVGKRQNDRYDIQDDQAVLDFFSAYEGRTFTKEFVQAFCGNQEFFGANLNECPGFAESVYSDLLMIEEKGMAEAVKQVINKK